MLIQAAGHGLLRLSDSHPGAVIKPTTATEAEMYVRLQQDITLLPIQPFVPRLIRVTKLQAADPHHPAHTHEVEIENLCMLGQKWDAAQAEDRSSDDDAALAIPPIPAAAAAAAVRRLSRGDGRDDGLSGDAFPAVDQASFAEEEASAEHHECNRPADAVLTPGRTEWSDPCVLDIKLGRIRHGPRTKPDKVRHILEKDKNTTGPSLALRICGLRHEHRQVDVDSLVRLRNETNDVVVTRVDSFTNERQTDIDDDDEHRSALHDYDTMRSQRGGERSRADSLLSGAHTPLANSGLAGVDGGEAVPPPPAAITEDKDRSRKKKRLRAALGRRLEWIEGKSLGRSIDRMGFVEAIAKYCTCVELRGTCTAPGQVATASRGTAGSLPCEHAVPEQCESRSSSAAATAESPSPQISETTAALFQPQPHRPLVVAYRDAAVSLRDALGKSDVLNHYSFSSASVICVHDFHVDIASASAHGAEDRGVASVPQPSVSAHPWSSCASVRFRAQLRLVDFSSSGAIADGNVFPDNEVGCLDGLNNLVAMLDEVLERYCATPTATEC